MKLIFLDPSNIVSKGVSHLQSSSIPPESYRVNHPFLFFLVDNTKSIIFSGRVKNFPKRKTFRPERTTPRGFKSTERSSGIYDA